MHERVEQIIWVALLVPQESKKKLEFYKISKIMITPLTH